MEEILKELQGKNMTKNKLFEFLSTAIGGTTTTATTTATAIGGGTVTATVATTTTTTAATAETAKIKPKKQCEACMKNIKTLDLHYKKSPTCLKWNNSENVHLQKGIHLIIDEILENSISINGKLECKFCNKTFVNNGNLHKHFNNSTICNRLAHQEFKQRFNAL